jgi:hypothetical protein
MQDVYERSLARPTLLMLRLAGSVALALGFIGIYKPAGHRLRPGLMRKASRCPDRYERLPPLAGCLLGSPR